jgi:hypothetical protein
MSLSHRGCFILTIGLVAAGLSSISSAKQARADHTVLSSSLPVSATAVNLDSVQTAATLPAGSGKKCSSATISAGRPSGGGGAAIDLCVQQGGGAAEAQAWLDSHRPTSTGALRQLPAWCTTTVNSISFKRFEQCGVRSGTLTLLDGNTGAELGQLTYLETDYQYTAGGGLDTVGFQIQLRELSASPRVAGSSVVGFPQCSAPCSMNASFPSQLLRSDADATADGSFQTLISAPGAVADLDPSYQWGFTNPAWSAPASSLGVSEMLTVRCDNATPNRSIGCVVKDFVPRWLVPTNGGNANFGKHLLAAQNSGLPATLTRLTDEQLSTRNGNKACDPRWPRPSGLTCDEYPFRSTYEGASTTPRPGPGRTFSWCNIKALGTGSGPAGWSACMIPATENSSAGGLLGAFYGDHRIIDRDRFEVDIV